MQVKLVMYDLLPCDETVKFNFRTMENKNCSKFCFEELQKNLQIVQRPPNWATVRFKDWHLKIIIQCNTFITLHGSGILTNYVYTYVRLNKFTDYFIVLSWTS
ncbi:uncharacterized protein [Fopius arisanus]|uniref:Uncharacterized protein isoform X3 n=1 Tax=Fopius arisanus TaxID=64838 RepID=A0A9R1UA02_9HYME|nr:PREDICTED: uncharacterized protein LOC105272333 isoform X3 [Fopius arisanus]